MEASLYPPNAILFVFDIGNKNVVVPEYVDDVLTAANRSCISVGTQADVDGEVMVKLQHQFTSSEKEGCQQVFKGIVQTPGNKIAVVTSEFDSVIESDVEREETEVAIWTDDPNYPSAVLVEAK